MYEKAVVLRGWVLKEEGKDVVRVQVLWRGELNQARFI